MSKTAMFGHSLGENRQVIWNIYKLSGQRIFLQMPKYRWMGMVSKAVKVLVNNMASKKLKESYIYVWGCINDYRITYSLSFMKENNIIYLF